MSEGILYLVATPIGNLADMTYRAVDLLKTVDIIYAEDTRQTKKLLNHYMIETPLDSYHQHNEMGKSDTVIAKCLAGQSVALVSDAGTPRLSDPGDTLIAKAVEAHIKIVPIPGASALLTALVASPFPMHEFTFIGFIPTQKKAQKALLNRLKAMPGLLVLYEAPHRINATLKALFEGLGERPIYIGRELTKKFEEHLHLTLAKDLEIKAPRGEYVIIVEGNHRPIELDDDYASHVELLMADGLSEKDAIKEVAHVRNLKKNTVYMAYQQYKKEAEDGSK